MTFPFHLKMFDPPPSFHLHSPLSMSFVLASTLRCGRGFLQLPNVLSSNNNYKLKGKRAYLLYVNAKMSMI